MSIKKGFVFGPRKSPPPVPQSVKDKIRETLSGRKRPNKVKEKIRKTMMGQKYTEERKHNMSIAMLGTRMEEKNHKWKGNAVGYFALHSWVNRRLGKPSICAYCQDDSKGARNYQWANISRAYKRELSDWIRLCAKCHKAYDMGKIEL